MAYVIKSRYLVAIAIALAAFFLASSPLAEGGLALKVNEIKIGPKNNHRGVLNATTCNVTDKPSTNYGLIGTNLPNLVPYRVNPSSAPSSVVIRSNLPTIVDNSFDIWSAASGVTFNRGVDTSKTRASFDKQNIVAWGRLSRSTLGATYIWYVPSSGAVVEVDTILNSRLPWSWTNPTSTDVDQNCSSPTAYDVQNILVHEIGHWVGLDDLYDPEDEDLTMFGFGDKGELKKDTLESGDVSGASAIY